MHETVNLKLFKQITIAPHKASAEASKIGNLEERLVGWLLSVMDVRAKTLMHGRVVEVSSLSVSVFLILQLSIHLSIYLPKWMQTLRFLALFGPACVRNSSKLHVFGILTWKWASRRSTVPFFDIPICKSAAESTSKWMLRILKNLDLPPTHDSSDHQDYYILRLGDAPRFAPAMVVGVLGGIWHWCKFGTQKICKLWDPRLYLNSNWYPPDQCHKTSTRLWKVFDSLAHVRMVSTWKAFSGGKAESRMFVASDVESEQGVHKLYTQISAWRHLFSGHHLYRSWGMYLKKQPLLWIPTNHPCNPPAFTLCIEVGIGTCWCISQVAGKRPRAKSREGFTWYQAAFKTNQPGCLWLIQPSLVR